MNSVNIFVKSLVVITFIWCIAECIMPQKNIIKYSSFTYGLIVISMVVSLFTTIDFENFNIKAYNDDTIIYSNVYLKELYEKKTEDMLIEKFGDNSIKIELTDDFKIKSIYCENKEKYNEIVRFLNENN